MVHDGQSQYMLAIIIFIKFVLENELTHLKNSFIYLFILKYSSFTMLCQFLVYSKVIQLYIYTFFFIFFSIMVYYRTLNIVPCAIQQDLVVYPFYIYQFASANSKFPIHPSPTISLGNCKSVLNVCEPVSVLQISSFVPYFRFHV